MRTIRIYQPSTYQSGQSMTLSEQAGQHVGTVLRMKPGDPLTLFSGDNQECEAIVESVKKREVIVSLGTVCDVSRESPLAIHLAQGLSKGDRMDLVMQKAVELGVASITPLITERCAVKLDKERMAKKREQWQAIAIAACEQSGRNQIPLVHLPIALSTYIQTIDAGLKLILHPVGSKTWRDYDLQQSNIALLIGPEGGLSDTEIAMACDQGFHALSLGPRILRTETAAITALSLLQAVAGDL